MAELGVFGPDDRIELLDGQIVDMSPIGSRHAATVDRLNHLLNAAVAGRAIVRVQNPIILDARSEPQPDVTLLRPRADFYAAAHPWPSDILLVIEVSDTAVAFDRSVKTVLYARAGVVETWLVDLNARRVTLYREPSRSGYRHTTHAGPGETLVPESLPGIALKVSDFVP